MPNQTINPSLAIGVIIKNNKGEILLVQEKRDKYYEKAKDIWGLPAGKVEWTETIENGLRREMREELNIEVKPIGLLGLYQYFRDNSQCLGVAILAELTENGDINYSQDEVQNVKWMNIDEILNSDTNFRYGVKEVLEDYKKNTTVLPFEYIRFFDLRENL